MVFPTKPRYLAVSYTHLDVYKRQYQKWVAVTSARSGQPGINAKEYESFTFFCSSLAEQQKIADCLSSVDELITFQTDKIEALKKHKKGLMQGMFPSIEEVSR